MIDLLLRIPAGALGAGLFAIVGLWLVTRQDTPRDKDLEFTLAGGGIITALVMGAVFVACRLMFA